MSDTPRTDAAKMLALRTTTPVNEMVQFSRMLEREVERLRELLIDWCDHAHGIGAKSQAMLVSETDAAVKGVR